MPYIDLVPLVNSEIEVMCKKSERAIKKFKIYDINAKDEEPLVIDAKDDFTVHQFKRLILTELNSKQN